MTLAVLFIGVLMVVSGIFAIEMKNALDSFIFLSLLSLLSVFLFIIMRAPDVAITEAAIGTGLVTAILVLTLRKIGGDDQ